MKPSAWFVSRRDGSATNEERIALRNDAFRVDLRLTRGADISFRSPHRLESSGVEIAYVDGADPDPVIRRIGPRGRIVEVGQEADRFDVTSILTGPSLALAGVENRDRSSEFFGARHLVAVPALFGIALICYRQPQGFSETTLALRSRRHEARELRGPLAWVARAEDEATRWASEGDGLALSSRQSHFHLLLGRGSLDVDRSRSLLDWCLHSVHPNGYNAFPMR